MRWQDCLKFRDSIGTIFEKGPFVINGISYDYVLFENGFRETLYVDYCTTEQIQFWIGDEPVDEVK